MMAPPQKEPSSPDGSTVHKSVTSPTGSKNTTIDEPVHAGYANLEGPAELSAEDKAKFQGKMAMLQIDVVEEASCFNCGSSYAPWMMPTGHPVCDACRDQATNLPPAGPTQVDLRALMSSEPPEHEQLIDPVLPARRQTGFVASRGEGKSLFVADITAHRAVDHAVLNQPAGDPIHVIYLDMEMGQDDLYDRLAEFGWTVDNPDFDKLVEHFHYYQLIEIPPLDTEEGGIALEELVAYHDAKLVVIDTVTRVISGDENSTETFRDLFRHTETRLKRAGVTVARLDHLGKDTTRGSRGASAKEDPLDVVWILKKEKPDLIQLNLTKSRTPGLPKTVDITQQFDNGVLRHVIADKVAPTWLVDLVLKIDGLELPDNAGTPTVQKALQAVGDGRRRTHIAEAVRFRKGREQGVPKTPDHPRNTPREHLREHPGTPTQETGPEQGKPIGNTHGNTREQVMGVFPPLKGGTPLTHPDFSDSSPIAENLQNDGSAAETINTTGDSFSTPGVHRGNYCRCGDTVYRYTADDYPYCKKCGPESNPTSSAEKPPVADRLSDVSAVDDDLPDKY